MPRKKTDPATKPSQAPLLTFKMPKPLFESAVALAYIQAPADGIPPTKAFVENVARWGVIEPIILVAPKNSDREDGYEILEGRRRFLAADQLGHVTIPAIAYQFAHRPDVVSALTLALNTLRSRNPLAEFLAIRRLIEKDMTDKEICLVTGLPLGTVRKRKELMRLKPVVLEAIAAGKVHVTIAERMAKLPAKVQRKLEKLLAKEGRLTGKDLHRIREVQRSDELAKHADMFENLPVNAVVTTELPEPVDLNRTKAYIRRTLAYLKTGQEFVQAEECKGLIEEGHRLLGE